MASEVQVQIGWKVRASNQIASKICAQLALIIFIELGPQETFLRVVLCIRQFEFRSFWTTIRVTWIIKTNFVFRKLELGGPKAYLRYTLM